MPDQPNDEPKVSPSVMKVEFSYREYTGVMAAAAQIFHKYKIDRMLTYPGLDTKSTIVHIKNIIDTATHLSAKEAALLLAQECIIDILEDIAYDAFPEYPKPGCRKDRILTKAYKFLHSPITKEALKP